MSLNPEPNHQASCQPKPEQASARRSRGVDWRLLPGLCLILAFALAVPAAADISGTVYRDINGDGIRNAGEPGLFGVTVRAFVNGAGAPAATTTTALNGTYTLTLGAGNYRIEFGNSTPTGSFSSAPAGNTRIVFRANGATGVDTGLHNPLQFCQANPPLTTNCYIDGNQDSTGDVLISLAYTASGDSTTVTIGHEAAANQIGTTWGLAHNRTANILYAGSHAKRHAGYGDQDTATAGVQAGADATGTIWMIPNPSNGVVDGSPNQPREFVNLNDLFPGNPFGDNTHIVPSGADPDLNSDVASYPVIGKTSMGDLDISDDDSTLWLVNMQSRELWRVSLGTNPAAPVPPTAADITTYPLGGLFDCENNGIGSNPDLRPFGVKYHDGRVYVGAVCTSETAGDTNDTDPLTGLRALVFRFDPGTGTFAPTPVVNFLLNYNRGCLLRQNATCQGGSNTTSANWQGWEDDFSSTSTPRQPNGTIVMFTSELGYPQPMLSDIEFTADGTMILGLRDRWGDQLGRNETFPDGTSVGTGDADAVGDILRARDLDGDGIFTVSSVEATNGTEFFSQDDWTDTVFFHAEVVNGGLGVWTGDPGNDVAATVMDPLNGTASGINDFSGGLRWFDAATGLTDRRVEVYDPDNAGGGIFFGKANGLGDLEALCNAAPLQVGNRVWNDLDRDGVQDPGEPGINGVTVFLFRDPNGIPGDGDDVAAGSVVTAGDGNYILPALPGTRYYVRLALPANFTATIPDSLQINDGNDDARDSDGLLGVIAGTAVASFTTAGPGANNHTIDLGLRALSFDWGDLPAPYATLAAANGPNHEFGAVGNVFLGVAIDQENDGQPDATATGDDLDLDGDDEDGVVFNTPLAPGSVADITVTATGTGVLNAWIDFNSDGDFADAGEQIATNLAVVAGANLLDNVPVPATATGVMAARFRITNLSGQGGGAPTGPASTGEVEDYILGSIGDFVWLGNFVWKDSDGDGVQDAGEPGVPGVVVNLLDCANNPVLDGNGVAISTLTDAAGAYAFPGLAVGCYRVQFVAPSGTAFTLQDQGGDDTLDSDPNRATGITANVNVLQGVSNPTVDAGLLPATGAIGNYVWVDENSDGLQDAGEPGIPNAAVRLSLDTTGDGLPDTVVATTATDAAGGYLFTNLLPGLYFVDVLDGTDATVNTLPAGLTQTTPSTNPNSDFGNQSHAGNGYVISLPVGGENLTADFGYNYNPDPDVNTNTGTAAIGDRVWIDADGDGAQDPNELGLAGVTVNLLCAGPDGEFGTGDDVAASTVTDATGNYLFDNLTPSACTVTVVPPPGYTQTGDPDDFGQPAGNPDNTTTNPVILGPGDVFLNADFGYQPPAAQDNSVGDTVWNDLDGDGIQDAGEPGIPGVTVKLALDVDGDGIYEPFGNDGIPGNADDEPIVASDTTDASGVYGFSGVPDGNYVVCVTDTDNVLSGLQNTGDPDDDGVPGNGDEDGAGAVDLDSGGASAVGVDDPDQDFGYTDPLQDPGEGAIGDTVFLDSNANNSPDSGEGIEGVVVKLLLDPDGIPNNGDEVLVATDTTDENGNYFFGNLDPAATYTVMVDTTTLPPGLANTFDPDGGNDDMSSTDLGVNGPIDLNQDFGYQPAGGQTVGSIGNLVWLDANADGVNDGPNGPDGLPGTDDDEPGLAGKTLDLYYDANGNGLVDPGEPRIASTTTDGSGNYLFPNLPTDDGTGSYDYVVDVSDTAFMLGGYWHSLGDQSQAVDDTSKSDTYGVTLTPAVPNVATVDFGYYVDLAALGNRVWIDNDFDGIQDPTELAGIPGVEVTLTITYPGGAVVTVQTTTDANGFYEFPNLLADEDYNGDGVAPEPTFVVSIDLADPDNIAALAGVGPPTMTDVNDPADDFRDSDNPAGVAAFATQGITDMTVDAPAPGNEANPEGSYDFGFRALEFDYGDLPDIYGTTAGANGANHETTSVGNVVLGGAPDTELDGQPSADGLGDDNDLNGDDEDGVLFLHPLVPGFAADIQVTASAAGFLSAFIDFNSDGDFLDAGEVLASDQAVAAGNNTLSIAAVPAGATGTMAARFRITTAAGQGGAASTGPASTGEVEDYVLGCIGNFVWNDLNGDGIQDGGAEVGVANVTVNLVSPTGPFFLPVFDANGTPISVTTDGSGNYALCGLPTVENSGLPNPGDYRVIFDLPAGFADFSPPNLGGDDALDSDADQDTNGTSIEGLAPLPALAPITINSGETDPTVDAGLRAVTAALITSAAAYDDGGSVVFEFSTGYEALSAGFEVYRLGDAGERHVAVTEGPIPALLGAPQGGVYRVVDAYAPFNEKLGYVVVEHQADGKTRAYGPFWVGVEAQGDRRPLETAAAALPHVSERLTKRLAVAREEAQLSAAGTGSGFADPGVTTHTMQVDVRDTGLYFVSSADIASTLGLSSEKVRAAVRQGSIVVENQGRAIAWLVPEGTDDGLYFHGEAIDSLYTLDNTYWLRINAPGVPMDRIGGAPASSAPGGVFQSTERFEQDVIPSINATLETEVDFWYWDGINAASTNRIRTFTLEVPDAVDGKATLKARFAGANNGAAIDDHHAILRLNGVEVGTAVWGGMDRFEATLTFNAALLTATTTLEVEGVLDGGSTASVFFIDGFELEYPRAYRAVGDALEVTGDGNSVITVEGFSSPDVAVFDLSDPALPKIVGDALIEMGAGGYQASFVPSTGATPYLVASLSAAALGSNPRGVSPTLELIASHHRYEHVVIAPQAWRTEAENLAAYRTSQGMRSVAVSVEEVYDAFSHGNVTPWAIRDFLAYARDNWMQAPEVVVLAGRGTFDQRNLQGNGDSFIPVVLVGTPHGLVSTDNVLADLEGRDAIPEVAIGRLPIVSAGELALYLEKLEAYDGASGAWRGRAVLVADNPDAAGNFSLQSDAVGALLGSFVQQPIYLGNMSTNAARAALQAAWNDGAQLVNYVGHGGVTQAAAEGLLRTTDMGLLTNGERLPIVSALTCVLGRSDIPNIESLAEALVTDTDGGAIAVWAPTGLSLSGAAHELNVLYAGTLEAAAADTSLGDIVLETLRAFGSAGGSVEMLNTYAIAGDPAVQLP